MNVPEILSTVNFFFIVFWERNEKSYVLSWMSMLLKAHTKSPAVSHLFKSIAFEQNDIAGDT